MSAGPHTMEMPFPPVMVLTGRPEVTVGSQPGCTYLIRHSSVSRQHAKFVRTTSGVEIVDLQSKYGTKVNGKTVTRTWLGEGDVVTFGLGPSYRFMGDTLRFATDATGMSVDLQSVSREVHQNGKQLHLLENINLHLKSGTFVALLGPSGAGKSVLFELLTTTNRPTNGQFLFDGGRQLAGPDLAYYRSKLGVVPQDDIVFPALTARENVLFAARLRLPGESPQELEATTDAVLKSVGLREHQNKMASVLSGGQRKRVSIAIELLKRPRLMLLDEPTTGQDPGMQAQIMDMLRGLARQGITIVASTHTLDTLHYFDSVIVLAPRGRSTTVVYRGPPGEMLQSFHVTHHADLFETLAKRGDAETPGGEASGGGGLESGGFVQPTLAPPMPGSGPFGRFESPVSFDVIWRQARIVLSRTFLLFRRDSKSMILSIAQPVLLASLIVAAQSKLGASISIHFFLIVAAIWLGMTLTVREVVRERSLYVRDRLAGLKPDAYLLGKLLFGTAAAACIGTALFWVARLSVLLMMSEGIRLNLVNTGIIAGTLVLIFAGAGGAIIGLIVSTLSKTEQFAIALLPVVVMPQILCSRIVYGNAGNPWSSTKDPYPALQFIAAADYSSWLNCLLSIGSLPMLSRPATAALDLLHVYQSGDDDISGGTLTIEWLYLLTLLTLLSVALYFIFRWKEKSWGSER